MSHSRLITALAFLFVYSGLATAMDQPEVIYQTEIPGYYIAHARDIVVDDVGNSYFIGSAYEDQHSLDVIVTRLNSDGTHAWTRYINGAGHCYATGVDLDSAGRVWVAGWTDAEDFPMVNAMDPTLTGFRDIFVMQLDPQSGNIIYSTYLGGTLPDEARDVALGPDGAVYVAGYTTSDDFPGYEGNFGAAYMLCRLGADGQTLDYNHYIESGSANRGNGVAMDTNGDIYLTGTLGVPASLTVTKLGNRFTTPARDLFPLATRLRGNYPNPFNPATTIEFSLDREQEVSLKVYDVAGREVADLYSGIRSVGDHQVRWNARGQADGVYMYRLKVGGTTLTRKMTLIK